MRGLLLSLTILAAAAASPATARTQDVWLIGIPPWVRANRFGETDSDYLEMFRPDAPWPKSANQLKVFETTGGLVLRESDQTLQRVFANLKSRHIALAIEGGMLTGVGPSGHFECGRGVEGYGAAGTTRLIAQRIKKNGGELAYIAMDEPLWYGHHFHGTSGCQASPD